MPDYATLDSIADSYNPLLLALSLIFIGAAYFKGRLKTGNWRLIGLAAVVTVAYGLMFADKRYGIWSNFGLDYSTHSATSLGMVVFMSYFTDRRPVRIGLGASFILYALLMLYQRYHSLLDILTTGSVVVLLLGVILMLLKWMQMQPKKSRFANQWPGD